MDSNIVVCSSSVNLNQNIGIIANKLATAGYREINENIPFSALGVCDAFSTNPT
jgi:hypothetical protein